MNVTSFLLSFSTESSKNQAKSPFLLSWASVLAEALDNSSLEMSAMYESFG